MKVSFKANVTILTWILRQFFLAVRKISEEKERKTDIQIKYRLCTIFLSIGCRAMFNELKKY